jgi:hypothetical protein
VEALNGLKLEVKAGTTEGFSIWIAESWLRGHDPSGEIINTTSASVTTKVKVKYKNAPEETSVTIKYRVDGCPRWEAELRTISGTGEFTLQKEMTSGMGRLTVEIWIDGKKRTERTITVRTTGNNNGVPARQDDGNNNNSADTDEWKNVP